MKVFLIIFVLISVSLLSNEDSQYAKTIRETAKSMGYQLTEEELETWIERLKSYNSNDIEKFDEDINAFVARDQISPPDHESSLGTISHFNCRVAGVYLHDAYNCLFKLG